MLTAHGAQFGRYQLIERIAVGGMAELYRAVLPGPAGFSKTVAIKCIRPDLNEDGPFRSLFLHEGRVMAALSHPNLVQVYELGETADGRLFLCLEYIHGCDLSAILRTCRRRGDPLDASTAAWIGRELCRGLDYVHSYSDASGQCVGIVHRDVSPHNVLLSEHGDVKLADFGIAKSAAHRTDAGGQSIRGKLEYLTPEQARGDVVSPATDVYAVGLLLYEMLTLQRYLSVGIGLEQKLLRAAEPQWRSVTAVNPAVPEPLEQVIRRALRVDNELRFPTADALGNSLTPFLEHVSTATCRQRAVDLVAAAQGGAGVGPQEDPLRTEEDFAPTHPEADVVSGDDGTSPVGTQTHAAPGPIGQGGGRPRSSSELNAGDALPRSHNARRRVAALRLLWMLLAAVALAVAGAWALRRAGGDAKTRPGLVHTGRERGNAGRPPAGASRQDRARSARDAEKAGRRDLEGTLGRLRRRARQRGLRHRDVPEVDALFVRASVVINKGSRVAAQSTLRELGERIERVVIDRGLLDRKLSRLRQSLLTPELRRRHGEKLRQAAKLLTRNRLAEANEIMNTVLDSAGRPR